MDGKTGWTAVGSGALAINIKEYEVVSGTDANIFGFAVTGNLKAGWKILRPMTVVDGVMYLEMGR